MRKILFIIPLVLLLSGCSCGVNLSKTPADGGVFRSADAGATWQHKVFVTREKNRDITIDGINVHRLIFSPLSSKSIYLFSAGNGLYLTDDEGENWRPYYKGSITSVALYPSKKDVVYITASNRLFKTEDGGQAWQTLYTEATPETRLNDVLLDIESPNIVYVITSKGTVLKSIDAGVSWQAIYRFNKEVSRIWQDQAGVLYVAMPSQALWRSTDGGATWTDLLPNIKKVTNKPGAFRQFSFIPGEADGFIYVTQVGMFKTTDGGQTWSMINLVTPPSAVGINTLAINPQNNKEIFYAINYLIYYSDDGGQTWITRVIPSKKSAAALAIKPEDPKVMYLGVSK